MFCRQNLPVSLHSIRTPAAKSYGSRRTLCYSCSYPAFSTTDRLPLPLGWIFYTFASLGVVLWPNHINSGCSHPLYTFFLSLFPFFCDMSLWNSGNMSLSTAHVYTTVTHDGAVLSSHLYTYYCTLVPDSVIFSLPCHCFLSSLGMVFWSDFGVAGSPGTSTAIPGVSAVLMIYCMTCNDNTLALCSSGGVFASCTFVFVCITISRLPRLLLGWLRCQMGHPWAVELVTRQSQDWVIGMVFWA